jgi:hypothetical protein
MLDCRGLNRLLVPRLDDTKSLGALAQDRDSRHQQSYRREN